MPISGITPFGVTSGGSPVEEITLENGRLSCSIITFGAALRVLQVPDRDGRAVDVVLGYDTLEEYETGDGYLGAVVGRYANRIANGRFTLDGQTCTLARNDGENHLHGGRVGYSHRVWSVGKCTPASVTLELLSPHGEEGYPGNLRAEVTYALEDRSLKITYRARCDRATPCNLTNHSYFNLSGHQSGPVYGQYISVFAEGYLPTDAGSIPLGQPAQVDGTPMDLREPTAVGAGINKPFSQLLLAGGYDHDFVIGAGVTAVRPAARAYSPDTGIKMTVKTTLPGLQFYTANYLEEGRPGKNGAGYGPRHGFCLETQFHPDSPNRPEYPSCILRPGEEFCQTTVFDFQ